MRNNKKARHLTLLMIFSLGCFLSILLFYGSYNSEEGRLRSLFEKAAAYRVRYIEDIVKDNLSALESFADLYASSKEVERDEFDKFAQRLFLHYPYAFEFRWIVRISDSERMAFEDTARKEGLADFKIKELDDSGRLLPAGRKNEYFSIYYLTPSKRYNYDHSSLLGLDTASIAERWQAMQIARDTASLAATGEIKHIGEPQIKTSSRVFIPIYRNDFPNDSLDERRQNLTGFISMVYRIDEMVEGALYGIPEEGINIAIYDVFEGEKKLLYFHSFNGKQPPENKGPIDTVLVWNDSFKVADRQWNVVCTATPDFLAGHRIILPWIILTGGFIVTLLLVLYLKNIIGRSKTIELLVNERTEQLKQANEGIKLLYKELEEKNEELKKLDQLKSDFVSIVSHELRTPLSIMKEGVSLVLDKLTGEINEKTEKTLRMVFTNIIRLNKIINDILDVSKIEAGRIQLKKTLADIAFVVRDTAEKWKIEMEKKQQKLLLEVGQFRINMYFDVDSIIQVLSNLISNAVKYTPEKGWIKVGLIDKKDEVEIYICDNGIGISEEDLPKVFGKFQQFSRTAGAGAKGTGLGLAISKELVEMHEGVIRVETKLGAGSKFIFLLPKKDSETVFKEHINGGIKEASYKHSDLSLIVMKISQFCKVQEALGSDIAHNFLLEIENIVKKTLRRKADTVVRDTGELIILLFDADKDIAKTVKERIEEVMKNYLSESKEKIIKDIVLSIGFSIYPGEAKNEAELLTKARGIIKTDTGDNG